MKIFYFVDSLNVGGREAQMTEIVLRLHARGHRIVVGCMRAEGRFLEILRNAGIEIREFAVNGKLASPCGIWKLLQLARYLRKEKFEVVHTQDLWSTLMGVPAAWLARTRRVFSVRYSLPFNPWFTPGKKRILKYVHRLSTVILVNSDGIRNFLVEEDGYSSQEIVVVRNAVDIGKFDRLRSSPSTGIPGCGRGDRLIAVTANMHFEIKGHKYLFDAAPNIISKFPNARFLLAGDGELRHQFENQVKAADLEKNILFLGLRKDVPEILVNCEIGLLPSLSEGLPNSVLEYMAAGLAIVATGVGGIPELIEPGVNGLLIRPSNSGELADAIVRLLTDTAEAKKLATAALDTAQSKFSFDRLIGELEGLYDRGGDYRLEAREAQC